MSINNLATLLKIVDLSLHYGQQTLLDSVTFELKTKEVVGVVGRNGSGKSSFLKVLAKISEFDSGKLEYAGGSKIVYVGQDAMIAGAMVGVSNQNLSGGEKRRLAIDQALAASPDVLILDEPTNHLDIEAIEKLEKSIKNFSGAVILVSHDRYFLDRTVTRMVEIRDGKLFNHFGNYQDYLESKSVRLDIESTQDERRLAFLKRELNWVRAGVKARGTKDKGRLDRFYNLKSQKGALKEEDPELFLPPTKPLGNKIINIENLEIVFNQKLIIKDLSFSFQPGTILGIVGPNGSGKTTLIKSILGEIQPNKGRIVTGINTEINYQDQEKLHLNPDKNPLQEIADGLETTPFGEGKISTRGYLRRFLFSNQQLLAPISQFSGGEKARLLLAKILKKGGNCLILDEPTNDLDLETISSLEESLLAFEGVAIVVSHDRYFLNRVCNKILSLEGGGHFILCDGGYDELLQEKTKLKKLFEASTNLKIQSTSKNPPAFNPGKTLKEIQKLENKIAKLEQSIAELETEFAHPDFYLEKPAKISAKTEQHASLQKQVSEMLEEWEKLSSQV